MKSVLYDVFHWDSKGVFSYSYEILLNKYKNIRRFIYTFYDGVHHHNQDLSLLAKVNGGLRA